MVQLSNCLIYTFIYLSNHSIVQFIQWFISSPTLQPGSIFTFIQPFIYILNVLFYFISNTLTRVISKHTPKLALLLVFVDSSWWEICCVFFFCVFFFDCRSSRRRMMTWADRVTEATERFLSTLPAGRESFACSSFPL